MSEIFHLQLLLATFAGWIRRHQARTIDYLIEENRALKEQLGSKRIRLTNDQRRRLAAKGKSYDVLPRRLPTTFVSDLIIHPRDDIIVISTHGRGMYAMDGEALRRRIRAVKASNGR